jgi:hypothetical protein
VGARLRLEDISGGMVIVVEMLYVAVGLMLVGGGLDVFGADV